MCPSRIHKRGLFALCSFRPEELICEYTGELIRNIICERREAEYQASGVDCYFFRINSDWVIDATYAGNYARFINHSCQVRLLSFHVLFLNATILLSLKCHLPTAAMTKHSPISSTPYVLIPLSSSSKVRDFPVFRVKAAAKEAEAQKS